MEDLASGLGFEGLASAATAVRSRQTSRLVVQDAGAVDVSKKVHVALSCAQGHPGLCRTRDAQILDDALVLARNIERILTSQEEGRFLRFSVAPYGGTDSMSLS